MSETRIPKTESISPELQQLVSRAEAGDGSVLPELRQALDRHPDLWRPYGDLAAAAERAWIALTAGDNAMLAESLSRQLTALKDELAGFIDLPPLERLLIERIVACWLQVHYADAFFAQLKGTSTSAGYLKAAAHLQDRAHQRYLFSIKQLALVRKLLHPAPSPIKVATRLSSLERKSKRYFTDLAARGVPVEN
jgi:hypothetical protein